MGINNLISYLRKSHPEVLVNKHISELKECKVAFDASNYLYRYKLAVDGDEWLSLFVNLISFLRSYNIHPSFFFDGEAPKSKSLTKEKRRKDKDKRVERMFAISDDLEEYKQTGKVSELLTQLMREIIVSGGDEKSKMIAEMAEKQPIKYVDIKMIEEKIEKMERQLRYPTMEDSKQLKELLEMMGIPVIQCLDEAERFASQLCRAGKIDYVASKDADVLVYGISMIQSINIHNQTFDMIDIDQVLERTGLSLKSFVDFCIMCGCDYNDNIPKIGTVTSLKLIKQYHTIEEAVNSLDDKYRQHLPILNHIECRSLFSPNISNENRNFNVPYCRVPDLGKLTEYLFVNNIKYTQSLVRDLDYSEIVFN